MGTKGIWHVFTLVLKPGHQAPKKQCPLGRAVNLRVCHQKLPQFYLGGTHSTQEEQWDGIKEIYWCVSINWRKHRPWRPLGILGLSILKASMDFCLCVKNIVNPWGNLMPGINEYNTQVPNNGKWDWWGWAGKITPAVNSAATTSPSIKLPADSCKDLGIQQGIWEDKSWVCLGNVGKKVGIQLQQGVCVL